MKIFIIKIRHIATHIVYSVPVLADSLESARQKATDWPYANDAYELV